MEQTGEPESCMHSLNTSGRSTKRAFCSYFGMNTRVIGLPTLEDVAPLLICAGEASLK
jgi:hypothetical protein